MQQSWCRRSATGLVLAASRPSATAQRCHTRMSTLVVARDDSLLLTRFGSARWSRSRAPLWLRRGNLRSSRRSCVACPQSMFERYSGRMPMSCASRVTRHPRLFGLGGMMLVAGGRLVRGSRLGRSAAAVLVAICVVAASVPAVARADGDPGSDVLVYQDLFAGSDAGLSVQQQLRLADVLKAAARAGFPVRVAIIASPSRPWSGHGAVAQPARVCPLFGDRAVAGVQGAAAGRDAERVRVQLARTLVGIGLPAAGRDPDPGGR